MGERDIGREAVEIANDLSAACQGRPTASVYIALSMMLGRMAATAERPDFDGLMALVDRTAFDEFCRARPSPEEGE